MNKVYWLSRHELSPAQPSAIEDLHGNVEIIRDPANFDDIDGLKNYIAEHRDGFIYAVAGAVHYLKAALSGLDFGVFENHPQKRLDGSFGLKAVYHICESEVKLVWLNDDPDSDQGELLAPSPRDIDLYGKMIPRSQE